MPTYDFKCEECGVAFELNIPMGELAYCEDCEKPLTKLFTPVPAIFKGTGWGGSK
jgi:putative FmdB family regulatory protein